MAINKEITSTTPHMLRVSTINFQLSLFPTLLHLKNIIDGCELSRIQVCGYDAAMAKKDMLDLKMFMLQKFLLSQQRSDIIFELRRVSCSIKLLDLHCKLMAKAQSVSRQDFNSVATMIGKLNQKVPSATKVTEKEEEKYICAIKKFSEQYHINGLSDKEKIEIVVAIGLSKGHWYKCPNGHYYCIGECGGAMEKSNCPECKATIGGSNHVLAAGNAHAGEMDDSRHAVWFDAANLENFDPVKLARLRL